MIDEYLVWLLIRGRGVTTLFLAPTPHEKPNEMLIDDLDSAAPSWNPSPGTALENHAALGPSAVMTFCFRQSMWICYPNDLIFVRNYRQRVSKLAEQMSNDRN